MQIQHFHSDMGLHSGISRKEPYNETPSAQTVQQAVTLGRVAVGKADIIHNQGTIVVIVRGDTHIYRDMYRILN